MSTSRTITTTISQPRASTSSRPADPPSTNVPTNKDEDSIVRDALARVERVKAWKAEEAWKKAAEEAERQKRVAAARRQAAQDARDRAIRAQEQENKVIEQRRRLVEAVTTRSRRDTFTGETSVSLRRPIVEIARVKSKGKGKASAQVRLSFLSMNFLTNLFLPVGDGPDDDDDEDREPCEQCKVKIPCLEQAGKRSSVILKCSYSGRPYVVKKEGGASPSGEWLAILESQMAQILANNWAL
ncbi:MAG: hypothetical protein NXY57DRAFT_1045090 [Lentinula lateritia]|nr:MAG: hypothetical protein NXY57DRAFT_1045090 [Lentinula lateritia]